MKIFAKVIVFFIGTMLLSGCQSQDIAEPEADGATVFGEWLWEQTSGGISGGQVRTAAPGEEVVLKLSADFQYVETRNGMLLSSGNFVIKEMLTIYSADPMRTIVFEDSDRPLMVIQEVSQNTLIVLDNNADGFRSTYQRMR